MKAHLLFVLVALSQLGYSCCHFKARYGETLYRTRDSIEEFVHLKFNLADSTTFANAIVADGIAYSGEERIPTCRYSFYDILSRSENDTWDADWDYLILVRNAFSQSLQERRIQLNKLKQELAEIPELNSQYLTVDSTRVILINGSSYPVIMVHDYLQKLRPAQIKSIHFIDRPVDQTLYGVNGQYGTVEIWATKRP